MAAAYDIDYTVATVTVSSTTVPVQLIAPGFKSRGFNIKNRLTSAQGVLIFPFTGPLPGAAPAGTWELPPNTQLFDNITSAASGADAGLADGWAAVLERAGSATVDALWV